MARRNVCDWACRRLAGGGGEMVSLPVSILEKCLVRDRIVIDTVVTKYIDHLQLYWQSATLAREAGAEIGMTVSLLLRIRLSIRIVLDSGNLDRG